MNNNKYYKSHIILCTIFNILLQHIRFNIASNASKTEKPKSQKNCNGRQRLRFYYRRDSKRKFGWPKNKFIHLATI